MPVYTVCPTCSTMFRSALIWANQYPKCCVDKEMTQIEADLVAEALDDLIESTRKGMAELDAGNYVTLDELEKEIADRGYPDQEKN